MPCTSHRRVLPRVRITQYASVESSQILSLSETDKATSVSYYHKFMKLIEIEIDV